MYKASSHLGNEDTGQVRKTIHLQALRTQRALQSPILAPCHRDTLLLVGLGVGQKFRFVADVSESSSSGWLQRGYMQPRRWELARRGIGDVEASKGAPYSEGVCRADIQAYGCNQVAAHQCSTQHNHGASR